ncbi:hypothetical protein ACOMHN_020696 [Nucella lapillus]
MSFEVTELGDRGERQADQLAEDFTTFEKRVMGNNGMCNVQDKGHTACARQTQLKRTEAESLPYTTESMRLNSLYKLDSTTE